MIKVKRKQGYYSISAVAKMFSVHQQTVRLYEKQGLINPKRSEGNTRLFSEEDVDRLEEIIYLTHELGINLAGVEMILKLKKQIKKLQKDVNSAFDSTQDELDRQVEASKEIIQARGTRLLKMNHEAQQTTHTPEEDPIIDMEQDQWEVEYEE